MKKIILLLLLSTYCIQGYASSFDYDISRYPFSMRGSYLSLFKLTNLIVEVEDEPEGLFIRNLSRRHRYDYMIRLEVVAGGKVIEPTIEATPEKVTLTVPQGSAEICFENPSVLRFRTTNVELRLRPRNVSFLLDYGKGQYRLLNGPANDFQYMITNLVGNLSHQGKHVTGKEETHPNLYNELTINLAPGTTGTGEFAIEEFVSEWKSREYKMPFNDLIKQNQKEYANWETSFIHTAPGAVDAHRLAAYINWSTLVAPRGQVKRESMMMSKNWMNMVWSWDHCFNAMAMAPHHPDVSWNQMMCIFDHQNELGALPDGYDDEKEYWGIVKTPIHGWALNHLIRNNSWVTREQLRQIYEPLSRWTDFWFLYRDFDGNGIPQYNHSYESFDDCTPLDVGFPLEAPELATFLVLQLETLSQVATLLGLSSEATEWQRRSDELCSRMMNRFWTGKRFAAKRVNTDEWNTEAMDFLQFVPLLLGDKLPPNIRKQMIANLKTSGLFTPFGLSTESIQSPFFDPESYTRGSVWAPINIFLIDGLNRCGEEKLARQLAETYCSHMVRNGFPERFEAKNGEIRSDPEYTWTTSVYLWLTENILTITQ